jgi:hypothetical protein
MLRTADEYRCPSASRRCASALAGRGAFLDVTQSARQFEAGRIFATYRYRKYGEARTVSNARVPRVPIDRRVPRTGVS